MCSWFYQNQISADKNKKIVKRAEKHGENNSSACFDDIAGKLSQMDLYNGNNALSSPQANNEIKGSDEIRSQQETEQSSEKRSEQHFKF